MPSSVFTVSAKRLRTRRSRSDRFAGGRGGCCALAPAGTDKASASGAGIELREAPERALGLALLGFEEAVRLAAERCQPHRIAIFLDELGSVFASFYEQCPVLKAEDEAVRASRLALCALTSRVLETGLGLLGITTPEQM